MGLRPPRWSLDLRTDTASETASLDRRLLTEGEDLGVRYNTPGTDENTITIVPAGGTTDDFLASTTVGESGTTTFSTADLDPVGTTSS